MKYLFFLLICAGTGIIPFQDLSVHTSDNTIIHFDSLVGKKVLIVNIATNSADSAQLGGLEELYQRYKDKLVIIAIPSNDFANEPLSNTGIRSSLETKYNIHYLVAEKQGVKDSSTISELYQWITQKDKNGMTDSHVRTDFYKYLVNGGGQLVGIYSNKVSPMDESIQNAIR